MRAAVVVAALAAAGCDDTPPPSPVPISPGPLVEATASVFLLRSDQMAGYRRSDSTVLTPTIIGNSENDPDLARTLTAQGYQTGARWTYAPPNPGVALPFLQVVSQASIFGTVDGATSDHGTEAARQKRTPEGGGTVTRVTDLPTIGVDALTVYVTTSGTSASGGPAEQSFLAIVRRGRVVAELFAGGDPARATEAAFRSVLLAQEQRLADAPT